MYKLLAYCDTPVVETGFAQVSKQILKSLHDTGKWEITVVGINHSVSWYDQKQYPYKIHAGAMYNDSFGREKFLEVLLEEGPFDVVFTFHDFDTINPLADDIKRLRKIQGFKWISYCPLDCDTVPTSYFDHFIDCDYAVVYTNWAKKVALEKFPKLKQRKNPLQVIYHGSETDVFKPLTPIERKLNRYKMAKIKDEDFLLVNVNRNQTRKDIGSSIILFKALNDQDFTYKCYLHCNPTDVGGNLALKAQSIGVRPHTGLMFQSPEFNILKGVSREQLNVIYNCADAVFTTTLGEGWGLSITEAMAAGIPVVAPDHSAISEILADGRGSLCKLRKYPIFLDGFQTHARYQVDIDDMIEKIKAIRKDMKITDKGKVYTGKTLKSINDAAEWVKENTWESINKQWIDLFNRAVAK